jgi:hypothetical protein
VVDAAALVDLVEEVSLVVVDVVDTAVKRSNTLLTKSNVPLSLPTVSYDDL